MKTDNDIFLRIHFAVMAIERGVCKFSISARRCIHDQANRV